MRWVVQTIIHIIFMVGMLLGGFWKIQNSINAASTKALQAQTSAAEAVKDVITHADKTDVHMPLEIAIKTFVPRQEVEVTLSAINDNLTGIKSEIIGLRQQIYKANGGGAP